MPWFSYALADDQTPHADNGLVSMVFRPSSSLLLTHPSRRWLTPELYLRRPPAAHPEWRLDRLLQRKAEQGVRIYVQVYKEVEASMTMSSVHTKVGGIQAA